jgi:hypothetical protein
MIGGTGADGQRNGQHEDLRRPVWRRWEGGGRSPGDARLDAARALASGSAGPRRGWLPSRPARPATAGRDGLARGRRCARRSSLELPRGQVSRKDPHHPLRRLGLQRDCLRLPVPRDITAARRARRADRTGEDLRRWRDGPYQWNDVRFCLQKVRQLFQRAKTGDQWDVTRLEGQRAREAWSEPPPWPGDARKRHREGLQQLGGPGAVMGTTEKIQRCRDAGEVPPQSPEQQAQLRRSVHMLVSAGRRVARKQRLGVLVRTGRRRGQHGRERRSRACRRVARRSGGRGSPGEGPGEPGPAGRAEARRLTPAEERSRMSGCSRGGGPLDRGCRAARSCCRAWVVEADNGWSNRRLTRSVLA